MENQELIDKGFIEGKKSFEFIQKEINENFDFEKVRKAMKATQWKWCFGRNKEGVERFRTPTILEMKKQVLRLLKDVYDENGCVASGGFWVGVYDNEWFVNFMLCSIGD